MKKNIPFEETFLTIKGWMASKLNLKGNKLMAFALIWGFCQDGESEFTGSINYVANWLNCSRTTAIKAMNDLCDTGYVVKRQHHINGVTFNRYRVNWGKVQSAKQGSTETVLPSTETVPGVVQKLDEGSTETGPNNIVNNISNIDKGVFSKNQLNGQDEETPIPNSTPPPSSKVDFAHLTERQLVQMGAVGSVRHAILQISPNWIWQQGDNTHARAIWQFFADSYRKKQHTGNAPAISEKIYKVRAIKALFNHLPEFVRTKHLNIRYIATNLNTIINTIEQERKVSQAAPVYKAPQRQWTGRR